VTGTLFLCGTPIGNLQDVSLRLLEVLRGVDLIAAEDTRHTLKLLNHFDIHRPLTSLHEHNEQQKCEQLIERLLNGQSVAVVSDAGMPGISDPGTLLVQAAVARGVPITAVPGPSAVLLGLVLSGLDTSRFLFLGFPPRNKAERQRFLGTLAELPYTMVFFEAPHRLRPFLSDLELSYGERRAAVARELTKQYESVQRGTVSELCRFFAENEPRGEFVVVLSGRSDQAGGEDSGPDWAGAVLEVQRLTEQGEDPSAAVKAVAKRLGISRRELYNLYHQKG
jgi:16S rRNA (cytidine1402-2'-O)-methyltransferase